MPDSALAPLVVVIGALITVGAAMVGGFRLERWLQRYLALPANVGAPAGAAIGAAIVLSWAAR